MVWVQGATRKADDDDESSRSWWRLGATGYIGLVLTEKALAEGHEVHGLSCSDQGDAKLQKLGSIHVRGDIKTLDVLREQSAPGDAILHLAWNHDWQRDRAQIATIDTAAVEAMTACLKGTEKPFIFASGWAPAGKYPTRPKGEKDEHRRLPIKRYRQRFRVAVSTYPAQTGYAE